MKVDIFSLSDIACPLFYGMAVRFIFNKVWYGRIAKHLEQTEQMPSRPEGLSKFYG